MLQYLNITVKVKNGFFHKNILSCGIMALVKMYSLSGCFLDSVLIFYLDVMSAGTGHNPLGVQKLDKE